MGGGCTRWEGAVKGVKLTQLNTPLRFVRANERFEGTIRPCGLFVIVGVAAVVPQSGVRLRGEGRKQQHEGVECV